MPRRTRLGGARAAADDVPPLERVFRHGDGRDLVLLFSRQNDDDSERLVVENGEPELFLSLIGQRGSVSLLDALLDDLKPAEQSVIFGRFSTKINVPLDLKKSSRFASAVLCAAASEDQFAFIEHCVVARGFNVEARSADGLSPLDEAARHNCAATINVLLTKCGASVNAFDEADGMSAAHVAAQTGSVDAMAMLQHHGADLRRRTRNGDGVVSLAKKNDNTQLLAWLLRHGKIDAESMKEGAAAAAGKKQKSSLWSVMFDENTARVLLLFLVIAAVMLSFVQAFNKGAGGDL
jgi:hypothetical protein